MNLMQKNKWLLARGPVCDVLQKDQEKMDKVIKSQPADDKKEGTELINYLKNLPRGLIDEGIDFIFSYLQHSYPIRIQKFKTGTNIFDWIVPEKSQKQDGENVYSMGELITGEWTLKGENEESIVLCCYLDRQVDCDLAGLAVALGVMKRLHEKSDRTITYRLAILPGTVGYAAYLSTLGSTNILGAFHLIDMSTKSPFILQQSGTGNNKLGMVIEEIAAKDNIHVLSSREILFDPVAPGHNPTAKEKLTDLPFDNIVFARRRGQESLSTIEEGVLKESANYLFSLLSKYEEHIKSL
jgi:hypothetical protein